MAVIDWPKAAQGALRERDEARRALVRLRCQMEQEAYQRGAALEASRSLLQNTRGELRRVTAERDRLQVDLDHQKPVPHRGWCDTCDDEQAVYCSSSCAANGEAGYERAPVRSCDHSGALVLSPEPVIVARSDWGKL